MALLARQLYFEAVKVGDELPPLVKPPIDRTQIARYAGASGDFNPLYIDEQLARNTGFPSAHVPGMLVMGFLGELVVDWLRGARLRRYMARFVKIVWPGDVITCHGRVIDRRFEGDGAYAVDIEVHAENQRGELVLKGLVSAQLYYSAEDDARQRAGQPALVITPEEEEARLAKLSRAQAPRRPEPRPPPPPPAAKSAATVRAPAAASPPSVGAPQGAAPADLAQARGASAAPRREEQPAAPALASRPAPAKEQRPAPRPAASPARPGGPAARPRAEARARASTARPAQAGRPTQAPRAAPASKRSGSAKTRIAPRPPPKAKPVARGIRPRAGSNPTGKKRR